MKVLLIGYGKMGKAIEAIAQNRGHIIAGRADNQEELSRFNGNADVAIEFTQPDAVLNNLRYCIDHMIPVVCGTTGWLTDKSAIEKYCLEKGSGFFYASNYSLGVNIFFKLNQYLAKLMSNQSGYEISIDETHHTQKKDAPSGTAITLAEGVINNVKRKKEWILSDSAKEEAIAIRAFREDPAAGTHVVRYTSKVDDIEIKHTAHSREGFALGAVVVAEWLAGKKGVFSMDDFLKF